MGACLRLRDENRRRTGVTVRNLSTSTRLRTEGVGNFFRSRYIDGTRIAHFGRCCEGTRHEISDPRRFCGRCLLRQSRPRQCRLAARSLGLLQQDRRRAGGAGRSQGRAEILFRQPRHRRAPGAIRPRQCRLAARSLGQLRQGRRRAGGAGRSQGRAEILFRQPRHSQSASRNPTPAMRTGSAISRSATTRSATCRWRRAISRPR